MAVHGDYTYTPTKPNPHKLCKLEEARLKAENERLRAALRTSVCPGSLCTVGECVDKGECGCDNKDMLSSPHTEETEGQNHDRD